MADTDDLWALELDQARWPIFAHIIVSDSGGSYGSYRTACDRTMWKADTGCWSVPVGERPLQDHAICTRCLANDPRTEQPMTEKGTP